MPKYKTAQQLDILPMEHKALVAFVKAKTMGRIISLNGHAHYYDQSDVQMPVTAQDNECGTAGCVAGFVFAHITQVQNKPSVRGCKTAEEYIGRAIHGVQVQDQAWDDRHPIFAPLYSYGSERVKLKAAQKVVEHILQTGKVKWPNAASSFR